ncbi:MAG TPA: DUF1232 domain-containing protein [Firmicutes bacterium]|jgi:uncharacterized membrane protein YkvA (DUF1232 family)|nr:DUF1232 domain-containing protein [Bacillota bacterium]
MITGLILRGYKSKAGAYINDRAKAEKLLHDAVRKANGKSGPLVAIWADLLLFFNLLRDWKSGCYRKMPSKSLLLVIAALLYFLNPLDLMPDLIPLGGLVDDATILAFVIKQIRNDLQAYKSWLQLNRGYS